MSDEDGFDDFDDASFPSDDEADEGLSLTELDEIPTAQNTAPSTIPGVTEQQLEDTMTGLREQFKGGGSQQATERLLHDLACVQHTDTQKFGYITAPRGDDLYTWDVSLVDFEGDMGKDLDKWSKATSQPPHVKLEMTFSSEYPVAPPFIRVLRPRFKFHTAHVTIGGSICMELLTKSGWSPCNDIDSVLVQIRTEMIIGNARLDPNFSSGDYTEAEAKAAFARVARQHGWE